MCGRIVLTSPPRDIAEVFALGDIPGIKPRFNIPPGGPIAAILAEPTNRDRVLRLLSWGLVPTGPRHTGEAPRLINARAESITRKNTFAASFAHRRCLIPVNGFYEWKQQAGKAQPFLIRRTDRGLFALAGIWDRWEFPGGKVQDSCAIITTAAAEFMKAIHHRMPAIIRPEHWQTWLTAPADQAGTCEKFLGPASPELITHPVDPRVGDPGFDGPECLAPWRGGHDGQLDLFAAGAAQNPDHHEDAGDD